MADKTGDKPARVRKVAKGNLRCRVITPRKGVTYDEFVESVELSTEAGRLEIFSGFEPTVAPLKVGVMRAKGNDGSVTTLAVHGGYMDMNGKALAILADSAEIGGQIDVDRAREALERAKKKLAEVTADDANKVKIDVDRAKQAMLRALTRLEVVGEKPAAGQ